MDFAELLKKRAEETDAEYAKTHPKTELTATQTTVTKNESDFAALLQARDAERPANTIEKQPTTITKDNQSFTALLQAREDAKDPSKIITEFQRGDVGTWSFSTLTSFEQCPFIVYQSKIERKPQKQGDAAARGEILHQAAEDFVRGITDTLHPELAKHFRRDIEELRDNYFRGFVQVEEDWGIRTDWSPCGWKDPELWGRAKLDVFVHTEDSCRIIDYKSGRKFGNELKHSSQGLNYALHAAYRYPEIEIFEVEFWYIDHNEKMRKVFSRKQLEILLPRYHARAMAMTTEKEWLPKPSRHNCNYCPYGNGRFGTGDCPHAE